MIEWSNHSNEDHRQPCKNLLADDDSSEKMEAFLQSLIEIPLVSLKGKSQPTHIASVSKNGSFPAIVELNATNESNWDAVDVDDDSLVYRTKNSAATDKLSQKQVNQLLKDDNSSESSRNADSLKQDDDDDDSEQPTQPETPPSTSVTDDNEHLSEKGKNLSASCSLQSVEESFLPLGRGLDERHDTSLGRYIYLTAEPPSPVVAASYNPLTGHSPHRRTPVRKEIMGMSVLSVTAASSPFVDQSDMMVLEESKSFPHHLETVHSEDDSEVALEMAAQHIRNEMWHAEMLELAAEAEKAAEAGEDYFAAKPCVFQDTIHLEQRSISRNQRNKLPLSMRRCVSEGSYHALDTTKAPKYPKRLSATSLIMNPVLTSTFVANQTPDKLSVVELRDVNEVFPSFRQFHTHLRTHFYRSNVSQEQLFYYEASTASPLGKKEPSSSNASQPANKRGPVAALLPLYNGLLRNRAAESSEQKTTIDQMQANFFRTFSLDQWSAPHRHLASKNAREDGDDDDSDSYITDLVSEVLTVTRSQPVLPRTIEIPPGLEAVASTLNVPSMAKFQPRFNIKSKVGIQLPWVATQENDERCEYHPLNQVRSFPPAFQLNGIQPRSLFDATDNESVEVDTSSVEAREIVSAELKGHADSEHRTPLPRYREDAEPSNNSLLGDEIFFSRTPITSFRRKNRSNSILSSEGGLRKECCQQQVPDFVTPARLRFIRGMRKDTSESTIENGDSNRLFLDNSLSQELPLMPDLWKTNDVQQEFLHPIGETTPSPISIRAITNTEPSHSLNGRRDRSQNKMADSYSLHKGPIIHGPTLTSEKRIGIDEESDQARSRLHVTEPRTNQTLADVNQRMEKSRTNGTRGVDYCRGESDISQFPLISFPWGDSKKKSEEIDLLSTPKQQDCSCLSLSSAASYGSDDVDGEERLSHTPTTFRRSTSLGTLRDSGLWNRIVEGHSTNASPMQNSHGRSIRAAMSIISKLSPKNHKSKESALVMRLKENDDFMNNFLYCSKLLDERETLIEKSFLNGTCLDGTFRCGEANTGFCCTSFINDAMTMGAIFHPRHHAPARNLVTLSSSGVAAYKNRETPNWLDRAAEKLDGVVDNWVDQKRPLSSAMNKSFQAPSLKKSEGFRSRRTSCSTLEGDETSNRTSDDFGGKFDGIGLYDIDGSIRSFASVERQRHAHHVSLNADALASLSRTHVNYASIVKHSQHDLSDTQFDIIYGLSPQKLESNAVLARSLTMSVG